MEGVAVSQDCAYKTSSSGAWKSINKCSTEFFFFVNKTEITNERVVQKHRTGLSFYFGIHGFLLRVYRCHLYGQETLRRRPLRTLWSHAGGHNDLVARLSPGPPLTVTLLGRPQFSLWPFWG